VLQFTTLVYVTSVQSGSSSIKYTGNFFKFLKLNHGQFTELGYFFGVFIMDI